ncbi:MAG: GntR family transcriptional regulator [Candidatus Latescibacterota bacterium]|nr:MAG: GntR family transcriptional regulator [Candidatus Latescibacterota bacterium]
MLIVVDPHSGVPVYRQIMDQVKFHVASGLLNAGDELPSTRALSSELGINPMTISKAYSYLEREGVVERRPGRPLVVKAFETNQIHDNRINQLRESLAATVTIAKQLGIRNDEAIAVFRELLENEANPQAPDNEGKEQS